MSKRRNANQWSDRIVSLGLPLLGFIGGMAFNAFTIAEKIATKPYVDERFDASRKYTDEKAADTLKDAINHSDMNRAQMMTKLESFGADVKAQGVKVDVVLDTLRSMQVEGVRARIR